MKAHFSKTTTLAVEQLLRDHKVKPTSQRVIITSYLLSTEDHPSADEVYEEIRSNLPVRPSRATVYNTLNALVEAGVIKEVTVDSKRVRYDANLKFHHHFVDLETGAIRDIPDDRVDQVQSKLGKEYDVDSYQVTFYGRFKPRKNKTKN